MSSSSRTFDRETLLDLSVNVIPMGIILFFIVVFLVDNPFGQDAVALALQQTLMVVMFFALAMLTYFSGKAIAGAEETGTDEVAYEGMGKAEERDVPHEGETKEE